jgi:nucleoside-diphosphate-sugar epimerase
MVVFVAGASGAIGRRLVPLLVERGHTVVGTTRSPDKAPAIEGTGARAVVVDAFDRDGLMAAVADAHPEVVVHELTALPARMDFRKLEQQVVPTNRLRTEGTRNLVDAATAAGARRLVAQSIAFAYTPDGARIKDEDAPLLPSGIGDALRDLDRQVTSADALEGVVLRYGQFYGPGTYLARDGATAADVQRRRFPLVGSGTAMSSFLHVDDAADATVRAIESVPEGIFNVTDDHPAPMSEWLPAYADAIGAPRPRRVPRMLVRLVAGRDVAAMATGLRGASNARFKQAFGWTPRYPSWREGAEALG